MPLSNNYDNFLSSHRSQKRAKPLETSKSVYLKSLRKQYDFKKKFFLKRSSVPCTHRSSVLLAPPLPVAPWPHSFVFLTPAPSPGFAVGLSGRLLEEWVGAGYCSETQGCLYKRQKSLQPNRQESTPRISEPHINSGVLGKYLWVRLIWWGACCVGNAT